MFGLKDQGSSEDKKGGFVFDLEKELRDPETLRQYEERVKKRLEKLKVFPQASGPLVSGNSLGIIRSGYESLLKVLGRIVNVNKKQR